jgi:hypothetical protein
MTKKILINFPQELLKEPIIFTLGHQFGIVVNIKRASVSEDSGWAELELEGDAKQVEEGISWMIGRGMRVEEMG